ncbi:MAG: carboxypeptidase regulatory-like domain-containing protein [Deltaproteobacteria bacterium]|nr:carboxypeptidase regulatory-like domain-containing protein [Deltaproteobacteria bacterium]
MLAPLVSLVPLLATQLPPPAQSFPAFDVAWERVLVGAPPVVGAVVDDDGAPALRGRFAVDGGVLRMLEPAPWGDSLWLSPRTVDDGVVRARLQVGAEVDTALLVRAALDEKSGELVTGIGVGVEKGKLRLTRFEHAVPRYLGAEQRLEGPLVAGSALELVVVLAGPVVSATVYDGATLLPRARVVVHDRGSMTGRVGWRVGKGHDRTVGLSLLSVGKSVDAPPLAARDAGAGAERLVVFAAGERDRLPWDLRDRIAGVEEEGGQRLAYLVTDPLGQERALRAGIAPVRISTQMPWKYLDTALYARLGKPPTATAAGFRVDESYKDAAMVEALLKGYAERFPEITYLLDLGKSHDGRTIWALKISDHAKTEEDESAVLLDGAHHGGELMSTEFVLDAVQQLLERYHKDARVTAWVDGLEIWCVPLVNVDGNARYVHRTRDYDRKNGRDLEGDGDVDGWDGVDLYRNYPVRWGGLGEVGSRSNPFHYRYRGPSAGSEPEVQAMMQLAERERFVASIDFHTNATKILVPYTDPSMTSPASNEAWAVAEEIAAKLPVQVNGQRYAVAKNLYPVDGTAQDWLRYTHGTVALLVEGPTNNPLPYGKTRTPAVVGTRPTWQHLLERVRGGPGVAGYVRDAEGKPVEAEVVIDEQRPVEGERWTTRPRDGRFARLLAGAGRITLRVRAEGFTEVTRQLDVPVAGTARVDVVLTRAAAPSGSMAP